MDKSEPIDGRHLRREQNRELVLDALVELFEQGQYTPTSRQIAEKAGLSLRSLVRYFDDFDDLTRSAIARMEQRALELVELPVGPDDPTEEKVRALVRSRVDLFEAIAPAARAGRVCSHRQPIVAEEIGRSRAFLRRQLTRLFQPELQNSKPGLLPAIDVLLSFEAYDLMRSAQGMSRTAVIGALTAGLEMLLDAHVVAL